MTEHEDTDLPVAKPHAPPTEAGSSRVVDKPPSWPTVLGVVSIVLGSLGAIGGCWSAVLPLFIDSVTDIMPAGQPTGFEAMEGSTGWLMGGGLVSIGLAVGLLVSGIGVRKRRSRAVRLCKAWAVLKMGFVVVQAMFSYQMQQDQFDAMQNSASMPAMPAGWMEMMGGLMIVGGVMWGWALPVFMLIWFNRGKVEAEVADWA